MLVDEARLKQIETNYPAELPREMGALVTVGLIADLCETVRAARADMNQCLEIAQRNVREADRLGRQVSELEAERDALRETVEAVKRLAQDAKLYSLPDAILANVERALSLETKS